MDKTVNNVEVNKAVSYNRLFHLLIDKKMNNAQLTKAAGISLNIVARLKKDKYISMESVEKICRALDCGVDEILEFVKDTAEELFTYSSKR